MGLLRTDKEVALNDLLVACQETLDHYRDAMKIVDNAQITQVFSVIVQEREPFIINIENAVRSLGDLPSVPDPDREAGEMLFHHTEALLSSDYPQDALEQRVKAEQHLLELIHAGRAAGLDESFEVLLNEISQNVAHTQKQLKLLID